MTSRQHQDWINRGKPDSGLALPLQLLANTLAAAGYTVYVYPNDAHLDAVPPEDHTYYSETGWPNTSPKWWRHAIDIMPPPTGRGLPSLMQIGQNIFNARQSGQITWLKYMNWPSDGNLSRAVQDRWEPNHSRGSSRDTGHIHLSSTTGCETLDSSFNPLTSVVVVGTTPTPFQEDLPVFAAHDSQGELYLCDGLRSRQIPFPVRGDVVTLINEGLIKLVNDFGNSRGGWYEQAFGLLETTANAKLTVLSETQVDTLANSVADAVVASLSSLSQTDKQAVLDATKQALRDGTSAIPNESTTQDATVGE